MANDSGGNHRFALDFHCPTLAMKNAYFVAGKGTRLINFKNCVVRQSALFTSAFAGVELPSGARIRVPAALTDALRVAILTGNEVCREVG